MDLTRLLPAVQAVIRATLADAMADLAARADAAYSGTRFEGTFILESAQVLDHQTLLSTDPLLVVVEEPTPAHSIDAKNGPYLWFKGSRGWARVAHVDHPGTAGKRYLPPLFAEASAAFGRALETNLTAVLRGL